MARHVTARSREAYAWRPRVREDDRKVLGLEEDSTRAGGNGRDYFITRSYVQIYGEKFRGHVNLVPLIYRARELSSGNIFLQVLLYSNPCVHFPSENRKYLLVGSETYRAYRYDPPISTTARLDKFPRDSPNRSSSWTPRCCGPQGQQSLSHSSRCTSQMNLFFLSDFSFLLVFIFFPRI